MERYPRPEDKMRVWLLSIGEPLPCVGNGSRLWRTGLACNVPFVSTNVSDLHRIATVEPSCQIAEANPTALADALAKTISAGRNANLRRHVESMDVGLIAQKYLAIYEEVCSLPEKVAA